MSLVAGTGRQDITPQNPMTLFGYPHVPRVSTGINDPLYVTSLYLANSPNELLIFSVDLLMLSTSFLNRCRQEISIITGIPRKNIMISCTHTHSGPVCMDVFAFKTDHHVPPADQGYLQMVLSAMIHCALQAKRAAIPALFAWTTTEVQGVGCNRHDPDGPRDPQASLLLIKQQNSHQLLAVNIVYSMHPTVLHEDSTLISADFPGYTRQALEKTYPGMTVLYQTGPAGNQSPRYHVTSQTFSEAQRIGLLLANTIESSLSNLPDTTFLSEPELRAKTAIVSLPKRMFLSSQQAHSNLDSARKLHQKLIAEGAPHGATRTAEVDVFGAEEALSLAIAQENGELDRLFHEYEKAEVQVFQIGPLVLVAFPGELFVEYALEIKKRAKKHATVISLANGELQGYIVTPGARGYEADFSLFLPSAGKILVEKALTIIDQL